MFLAPALQAAKALCSSIKFLPTDHQTKIETARVLAVSRAAYGWVAFAPPQCELLKVDEAIRHVSGAFLGAARHMRNLLLGGTTILEVVIGVRQALLYAKRWITGGFACFGAASQAFLGIHRVVTQQYNLDPCLWHGVAFGQVLIPRLQAQGRPLAS